MLKRLARPEFLYQPRQVVQAAYRKLSGDEKGEVIRRLPWGLSISISPDDFIGRQVYRYGVAALGACETAFRLARPGDTVIDIGANIGAVTAALVHCVKPSGRVIAIEMMPETFEKLSANVRRWNGLARLVTCVNVAASNRDGTVKVALSPDYAANSGLACVVNGPLPGDHAAIDVPCRRLDRSVPTHGPIKLAKIDVERHEFEVIQGAGDLISRHIVSNVLFEDAPSSDTPVKALLGSQGYRIFELLNSLWGPKLLPLEARRGARASDRSVDFLATDRPDEAIRLFKPPGYQCLKSTNNRRSSAPEAHM